MSTSLLLLLGAGALFLMLGRKNRQAEQIGRIKRRIYKEVSLAQSAGVDFSKKFGDLTEDEIIVLESIGADAGWKQSKRSIDSGKSYAESYYGSLRRAWNAVSGVQGIGKAYNVKDADGYTVLTWIEDAAAHVAQERKLLEQEAELARRRRKSKRYREGRMSPKEREAWEREVDERGKRLLERVKAQEAAKQEQQQQAEAESVVDAVVQEETEPIAPPTPKNKRASNKPNVSQSMDDLRRSLLNKAKHMAVVHPDDYGNSTTSRGEDRCNWLPYINYVIMAKVITGNDTTGEKDITLYPMFAGESPKALESYKPQSYGKRYGEYSRLDGKGHTSVYESRTYKIIPITDVKIDAISGIKF